MSLPVLIDNKIQRYPVDYQFLLLVLNFAVRIFLLVLTSLVGHR